jgi:hypothetical protein
MDTGETQALLYSWATFIFLFLLAASAAWRHRSWFTVLELSALFAAQSFGVPLSYSAYFFIKTSLSFVIFYMRLGKTLHGPVIRFLLGFNGEPHAGLRVGKSFIHYAFPRVDPGDQPPPADRSFGLVPQSDPPPRSPAWIDCAVGFAFTEDMSDAHVLQVLQSSGRCHDWAVVAAYVLSIDKWLTAGILLWARWLSWIAILIGSMQLIPSILSPPVSSVPGAIMEFFMVLMALMDSLNLRKQQLEANKRMASHICYTTQSFSFVFAIILGLLCTIYVLYTPAWIRCIEFPACLLLSALACFCVHRLIVSAEPRD